MKVERFEDRERSGRSAEYQVDIEDATQNKTIVIGLTENSLLQTGLTICQSNRFSQQCEFISSGIGGVEVYWDEDPSGSVKDGNNRLTVSLLSKDPSFKPVFRSVINSIRSK